MSNDTTDNTSIPQIVDKIFVIYRIVNFTNGKCYIGQTCNPKQRKSAHFSDLKRDVHKNIYLQRAFNKDGRRAFYFEILESGIPSDKVNNREIYWIAHFNSFKDGYNSTIGGGDAPTRGVVCVWNNQQFDSIADAARANNLSLTAMLHRIQQGWSSDADMPVKNKQITWNATVYESINEASRILGIPLTTLHRWVNLGFKGDEDIADFDTECTWNGITYKSASQAAKANGVHPVTMQERLRNGYKKDSDLKRKPKR